MSEFSSVANLRARLKRWLLSYNEIENWQQTSQDVVDFHSRLEDFANEEWSLIKSLQSLQTSSSEHSLNRHPLNLKGLNQNEAIALELLLRKSQNIEFTPEQDPEFPFAIQWFIPWVFWNDKNRGPSLRPANDLETGLGFYAESRIEEYLESLQESLSNDTVAFHFGYWDDAHLQHLPEHLSKLETLEESEWHLYQGKTWLGYGVIPVLIRGQTYHSVCSQAFEFQGDQTERFFLGSMQEKKQAIFEAKLQAWMMWSKAQVQSLSKITTPHFHRKTTLNVQRTGHCIDTIEAQIVDSLPLSLAPSLSFKLILERPISLSELIQPWLENEDSRHRIEWFNTSSEEEALSASPQLVLEIDGQDLKMGRVIH